MNHLKFKLFLLFGLILLPSELANGQEHALQPRDSALSNPVVTTQLMEHGQDSLARALEILKSFYNDTARWRAEDRELRKAIQSLIFHAENDPIETSLALLKSYPYGRIVMDTVPVEMALQDSVVFQVDTTMALEKMPAEGADSLVKIDALGMVEPHDTLQLAGTDTTVIAGVLSRHADSAMIPRDSEYRVVPVFTYLEMDDSVQVAMSEWIRYLETRPETFWLINASGDSTRIFASGEKPVVNRFWLKNSAMDSLGIWVKTRTDGSLRFEVDDDVYFNRITRGDYQKEFIFPEQEVDASLKEVQLIEIETNPWFLNGIGELRFSQVYLSNWSKGGENALSSLLRGDINAGYSKGKLKWENNFRLKYGVVRLKEEGVRKGEDEWEMNTSLGFKQSKQWYYSFGFNLKSQFLPGLKYPNDSVRVSSFLSPGYLYSSAGFEYKPDKKTSILASPLTFRSTFVIDTTMIDHEKFGIPADTKAKNEIGIYLKGNYTYQFNEDLSLENRLQFFTNYNGFNKVDFDYEANFRARLGPFFSVNLNFHFIYNSDVTFPVFDDAGTEIDGKPRLQFKEWLAVGLSYRF
jgi:hypothetical protein